MPVYNGEKYIKQAIDSILCQTFTNFELLIILDEDKDSKDKSFDIVKSYSDQRIKLIKSDKLGISVARNYGIKLSRGEYIANLDCDDISYPTRLQKQVDFLDTNPDFGLIGSFVEKIDKKSEKYGDVWRFPAKASDIPVILFFNNYFAQSATMIRKSMLPDAGYDVNLYYAEDYNLWIKIAEKSKVWNLPEVLIQIRDHGENTTYRLKDLHQTSIKEICRYQLNKLKFEYSDEELHNHYLFCIGKYQLSNSYLKYITNWFKKINAANIKVGAYDTISFTKALIGRWYLLCKSNDRYWWLAYKPFLHTSIILISMLSCKEKVTLLYRILHHGFKGLINKV